MANPIIEARADRFERQLRKLFAQSGIAVPEIDDPIIATARAELVRKLSAEQAARTRRRNRHEQTTDLFA